MEISRRSFLGGALSLVAASTLPLDAFAAVPTIYGDGFNDDSAGLQAAIDGLPFRVAGESGAIVRSAGDTLQISNGTFLLSEPLEISNRSNVVITNNHFTFDRAAMHIEGVNRDVLIANNIMRSRNFGGVSVQGYGTAAISFAN